jgi:hypothetical protein
MSNKRREDQMTGPERYGQYYWCVKTKLSKSGEIYIHADRMEFTATGGIIFRADPESDEVDVIQTTTPILAIAAGQWAAVFAASCLDGHAVAVDHWDGEVVR